MSEELDDLSVLDEMDIPEVMRDESITITTTKQDSRSGVMPLLIGGGIGFGILAVGAIALWQFVLVRSIPSETSETTGASTESAITETTEPETTSNTGVQPDQLLGHFAYDEAPSWELEFVYPSGTLKLRPAAAEKYRQMSAAARQNGINLKLISGFRSIEEQEYLFFEVKEQRAQDATKRAEVSAPPRHSEHHTGYAVDIGDGNVPGTNLSPSFENTAAFNWLQSNAARFSFELSFPRDNPQGIAYEPWHWRFVGDQDSLELFYKSRNFSETAAESDTETEN
ncbi:D-Ala-D-Ala carboxypeptidase [[Leptolyngbya] sp. PCC 7376]|uniref:M15 family metallopeptidase n=1 Tax=[Leptolyngbya] sp. PCC 7376 TaxID=111781 RepID=UPI00029F202D|nr:D-Ala-D-Ala carboxypeptidase [[Leptolyngbya] sp. PCC 7376]